MEIESTIEDQIFTNSQVSSSNSVSNSTLLSRSQWEKVSLKIGIVVLTSLALASLLVIAESLCIAQPTLENFVVQQLWSTVLLVVIVELVDCSQPGSSDFTYLLCYFVGFICPVVVRGIAYGIESGSSPSVTFVMAPIMSTILQIVYLMDIFVQWRQRERMKEESKKPRMWLSYHDTLSASAHEGNIVDSGSQYRPSFLTVNEKFTELVHISTDHSIQSKTSPALNFLDHSVDTKQSHPPCGRGVVASLTTFLPRYWAHARGEERDSSLSQRLLQWATTMVTSLVYLTLYFFVTIFATTFMYSELHGVVTRMLYFSGFLTITSILRIAMKRLGLILDGGKRGTVSLCFALDLVGLVYYYIFYRALFNVLDWADFAALETLHLAFEWVLYPLRGSKRLHDRVSEWQGSSMLSRSIRRSIVVDGLTFGDCQRFLSLDFGMRCMAMVVTITFMMIFWGFVAALAPTELVYFTDGPSKPNVTLMIQLLATSFVLEVLNLWLIYRYYFKPNNLHPVKSLRRFFGDARSAFVSTFIIAIILMNVAQLYNIPEQKALLMSHDPRNIGAVPAAATAAAGIHESTS